MDSEDIQPSDQLFLMILADGNLVALEIDRVPSYIIYFINIYYIGPVHLKKGSPSQLLLKIFKRAVRDIALSRSYEFYVIPHAFDIEDLVLDQFDQLVLRSDEQKIVPCLGRSLFLATELLHGFQEALIGERFFQVVVHMVLKGVEGIFCFGSGQDDLGRIGKPVE